MSKQEEIASPKSASQLDDLAPEIAKFEAESIESSLSANFPQFTSLPPVRKPTTMAPHPEQKRKTKLSKPKHQAKKCSAPPEIPEPSCSKDQGDPKKSDSGNADHVAMRKALVGLLTEFANPPTPEKETLDSVFNLLESIGVSTKLVEAYTVARRQLSPATLSRCIIYYIGYADMSPKTEAEALAYLEGTVTTNSEINRNLLEDFSNKLAMTVADLSAGTSMINKFVASINTADRAWSAQSAVISRYKTELEVLLKGIRADPPPSVPKRPRTPTPVKPSNPPITEPLPDEYFHLTSDPATGKNQLTIQPGRPLSKRGVCFIRQMEHWLDQGFITGQDLYNHDMIEVWNAARAAKKEGYTDTEYLLQQLLPQSSTPSDQDFYSDWDLLFKQ